MDFQNGSLKTSLTKIKRTQIGNCIRNCKPRAHRSNYKVTRNIREIYDPIPLAMASSVALPSSLANTAGAFPAVLAPCVPVQPTVE